MSQPNDRWKGVVMGMVGGAVGLLAMDYYWKKVAPEVKRLLQNSDGNESQQTESTREKEAQEEQGSRGESYSYPIPVNLDDISLVGRQYQDDESSTAALGRIIYTWATGRPPQSEETKTVLSYLVHWAYGIFQGAVYGFTHYDKNFPDVAGGVSHAVRLWLFGDELVVPLLGLQSGPTAVPPVQHANRLGAHLFYGIPTAAVTQALMRIF